jgi:glutamine amidotransferase
VNVTIVDYGVGNLGSIPNMLARVGVKASISSDPAVIESADRLILPGVGAFDAGMSSLDRRGLREVLYRRVIEDEVPTLGLCLGMHLLFDSSDEGSLPGLGWIPGRVVRFAPARMDVPLPIPNIGWHDLKTVRSDVMLEELGEEPRFYFAHSYHVVPEQEADVVAVAEYGYEFPICVRRGSIFAAQFHPEKSHRFGLQFLSNFVGS